MSDKIRPKDYAEFIIGLNDTHFNNFKNKILKDIDDEIEDIEGTISNEHLCELGFDNSKGYLNYHSLNIECYQKYLKKIQQLKGIVESFNPNDND